ncbi:hypothetical protein [Roseisolibacter agri]|uniref:Uncharacterized protein n=1 Tax=Roseisolibacter agri TaxID=2014610 RepID=A0AA37Q719_9BACT|nr:hypothetical protein [Roseisolibacter agri]GLC27739.1 hypothetical protein rosag_42520 [Roseisolibacter agri]
MSSLRPRRVARLAALPLLTVVASCRIWDDPPDDGPQPRISLTIEMLDAGDTVSTSLAYPAGPTPLRVAPAGGLVAVRGYLSPGSKGGRPRRIEDGRLVVNGTAIEGSVPAYQSALQYVGEIAARPADGVVTIALPRIEGIAPATLRMEGLGRAAGTAPVLSGGNLRLRVVAPTSRIEPPLVAPHWTVVLARDGRTTSVDGVTALPSELVLPVQSILPGAGPVAARLLYYVTAESTVLRPVPTDTTYAYGVTLISSLRFAPVGP